VWDLGSVAINGGSDAKRLFRTILLASASVPGMFPPVRIRFHADGGVREETHVDGGVTVPRRVRRMTGSSDASRRSRDELASMTAEIGPATRC